MRSGILICLVPDITDNVFALDEGEDVSSEEVLISQGLESVFQYAPVRYPLSMEIR